MYPGKVRLRMRPAVSYLLLADDHTYQCRSWDQVGRTARVGESERLPDREGAKDDVESDRPLIPSEAAALVEAATKFALAHTGRG
jgi:hypothetical protein